MYHDLASMNVSWLIDEHLGSCQAVYRAVKPAQNHVTKYIRLTAICSVCGVGTCLLGYECVRCMLNHIIIIYTALPKISPFLSQQ